MKRNLLLLVFVFALLAPVGMAVGIAPCTSVVMFPALDIIPLSTGTATYCVSDYGWTDTWFPTSAPAVYSASLDVLSGDDSPNLHFGIEGGLGWGPVSGFGWLSPIMDRGSLSAVNPTGSPWTVVTGVHLIGAATAESLIIHPTGMQAQIVTTLAMDGTVTQTFVFTNTTTATTFNDIRFADYFNFHPNGSNTPANASKGTITYDPLTGLTITGPNDGTLIANGNMRGERVDDAHGRSAPVFIAWDMVQTDTYADPGAGVAIGPGDAAGGLAWDLPDLAPGEFVSFTIYKQAGPLSVPEASSIALLSIGLLGVASVLRRTHG